MSVVLRIWDALELSGQIGHMLGSLSPQRPFASGGPGGSLNLHYANTQVMQAGETYISRYYSKLRGGFVQQSRPLSRLQLGPGPSVSLHRLRQELERATETQMLRTPFPGCRTHR